MSVLVLEGVVEGGQIRLLEGELPEKTRVFVVVPGEVQPTPPVWSPRLADPREANQFVMEVTEHLETGSDAEL